ncbi:hypothetical protein [Paenibacillus piri]|nr:hypothetical protein [Paenibacillus piri]
MNFEQDWIRETVIRRFDELAGRAERFEDVARLVGQADAIEKLFI